MSCKRGGECGKKLQEWNHASAACAHPCSSSKRRAMADEREGAGTKRVMVLVDRSPGAKDAMVWALTHVANKGDLVTLLLVLPPHCSSSAHREEETSHLINSLGSICKAIRPQVRVEALVIQGPKLATVLGQVKKLDVSVLVLKQSKPSPLCCMFRSTNEDFVEQCINRAECLTMTVRKQSSGLGGYLVSTRWQKNFWLLA